MNKKYDNLIKKIGGHPKDQQPPILSVLCVNKLMPQVNACFETDRLPDKASWKPIGIVTGNDVNSGKGFIMALNDITHNRFNTYVTWYMADRKSKEYKTIGTNKGDWQIPNREEMYSVYNRLLSINKLLNIIGEKYKCNIRSIYSLDSYWANHEIINDDAALRFSMNGGSVLCISKLNYCLCRPFLRF